jgi:hypothetical protein
MYSSPFPFSYNTRISRKKSPTIPITHRPGLAKSHTTTAVIPTAITAQVRDEETPTTAKTRDPDPLARTAKGEYSIGLAMIAATQEDGV